LLQNYGGFITKTSQMKAKYRPPAKARTAANPENNKNALTPVRRKGRAILLPY